MSTYLLPQPVPLQRQQQRQSFLSAHRLQVPPTLFYSYTSIRDSNHDNLVCTQTSSLTYLVLQLYLHQRQQPRQSCQQADFQSHLSSPTATPRDSNHDNLVSKQTFSPTYLVLQLHLHQSQQPQQSCQPADFQSHLPCSTATPPSKSATTTIFSTSRLQSHLSSPTATPRDNNHDNLVSKQTFSPTYLVQQLQLHQRQQPRQSCQQADFSPTYLLPQPHPETATTTILSASRLPVPPTLFYIYTLIKDSNHNNLVSKQTSSPTYLLPQPHLETATTTILSASRLPVPLTLFNSYTPIKDGSHNNPAREWRTHSALHLDAQGHVLSGCKGRTPSHNHNMFDK